MNRRKKATGCPEGFEEYIRERQFTDMEDLLLWDCAVMCECFDEALARWKGLEGSVAEAEIRSDAWKVVHGIADEISIDRHGRHLSMNATRWGRRLAERMEERMDERLEGK
jgi:hypothetical protein